MYVNVERIIEKFWIILDNHDLHCHDPDDPTIHLCIGDSIPLKNKCQQMTCVHYDGDVVLIRG